MAIFPKNLPGMKFAAYLQQEVARETGVKPPDGLLHAVGPPSESYKEEVQSETPAPQVLGAEDFLKNCIRRLKLKPPTTYNVSYPGTGLSDYQKNLLEHGTELAQKSRAALEQSLEAREGKSNNVGKEAPAPSKRKIVLED